MSIWWIDLVKSPRSQRKGNQMYASEQDLQDAETFWAQDLADRESTAKAISRYMVQHERDRAAAEAKYRPAIYYREGLERDCVAD